MRSAVPVGVLLPHVSPRCPAGLPASGECCPVVPVKEEEDAPPFLLERAIAVPTARPMSAKKPYFKKRNPLGSWELAALRTSLACPLPAFHAVLPVTLPTFGATRAPNLAPAFGALLFLLAIRYLHIRGVTLEKPDTLKGPFGNRVVSNQVPYVTPSLFTTSSTPATARTAASIPSLSAALLTAPCSVTTKEQELMLVPR